MATTTIQKKICPMCHARFEGSYDQKVCINCFVPDASKAWPVLTEIAFDGSVEMAPTRVSVLALLTVPNFGSYCVSLGPNGVLANMFVWQALGEALSGALIRALMRLRDAVLRGEEMPLQVALVPNKEAYERALLAY